MNNNNNKTNNNNLVGMQHNQTPDIQLDVPEIPILNNGDPYNPNSEQETIITTHPAVTPVINPDSNTPNNVISGLEYLYRISNNYIFDPVFRQAGFYLRNFIHNLLHGQFSFQGNSTFVRQTLEISNISITLTSVDYGIGVITVILGIGTFYYFIKLKPQKNNRMFRFLTKNFKPVTRVFGNGLTRPYGIPFGTPIYYVGPEHGILYTCKKILKRLLTPTGTDLQLPTNEQLKYITDSTRKFFKNYVSELKKIAAIQFYKLRTAFRNLSLQHQEKVIHKITPILKNFLKKCVALRVRGAKLYIKMTYKLLDAIEKIIDKFKK